MGIGKFLPLPGRFDRQSKARCRKAAVYQGRSHMGGASLLRKVRKGGMSASGT